MLNIDDRLIKEVSPKIKPNALSVLLAIAIHLNQKTNRCFPSHERLMALTGLGRDAVYGALQVLKENKLLTSHQPIDEKTKKFGRRTFKLATRFVKIFIDAEDADPLPESPHTEMPDTVEPHTESQETKLISNLEQINHLEQISKEEETPASLFSSSSENDENWLTPDLIFPQKPEKEKKGLQNGAAGIGADLGNLEAGIYSLEPPFTKIAEIEPSQPILARLYSPEHPDISIVTSVPGEYRTAQNPRDTPPAELRRVNISEEIERLKTDAAAKETFSLVRKIPSNLYADYVEAFGKEIGGTGETYQNTPAFRKHFFNWSGTRWEIAQKRKTQSNGKGSSLIRAGGDLSVYKEKQIF